MEIKKLVGHIGEVTSTAFSSGGTLIVSGSQDKSVRVWDIGSTNKLRRLTHSVRNVNSTVSANENTLNSDSVFPKRSLNQINWAVADDGWIVQLPTMNKIMWLPDTLTAYLYRPANTLIISRQKATLDLVGAKFGSNWTLCYQQA
ncbi:hypothetical protein DL96DRAFT_1595707 [Flagelloscypha sp. PMI_526]|nr:hypothetical protein DL96DRAFT_1595707 [Flagelloscypha sp. PMI_526]